MNSSLKFVLSYIIEFGIGLGNLYFLGRILKNPIEYGNYSYVELIISYVVIILGLGKLNAFIRYYYDNNFLSKQNLLNICLKNSTILFGLITIILLITTYLLGSSPIYILILIFSFINIVNNYLLEILKFENKTLLFSILKIAPKLTLLLIFFIIYLLKTSVIYTDIYIINVIILNLYLCFIFIIYLKKWYFEGIIRSKNEKNKIKLLNKKISEYSYPYILNNLISVLFVSADKIYIIYFLDKNDLGVYSMGYKIVGLLSAIYIIYSGVFTPIILKKYYESPEYEIKQFLYDTNQIISFILILMGLIYCSLSEYFLKEIVINSYLESISISNFLIFGPIFNTIGLSVFWGIILKEKPKLHLYISIITTTLAIVFNFILGKYYGIKGVAFATSTAWIIFYLLCNYYSNKVYAVKYDTLIINLGIFYLYLIIIIKNYFNYKIIEFFLILTYIVFFRKIIFKSTKYLNIISNNTR